MGKNLIIRSIERVTRLGEVESIPFENNVNLLLGSPHSGKTIWLQMLDYLLGDSDSPEKTFGAENKEGIPITEKYESASAEIIIGNKNYHIERRWHEYGMKTKVLVNGDEILESNFSEWILSELEIPQLHYPKGNPYSDQSWPKLSFRNLLRHVYRQEVYWSDIADKQPKSDQFATICLILGFAHKLFPDEYGVLVELNKQKMKYEVEQDEYKNMLDDFVRKMSPANENITVATEGVLKEKIISLKEELEEIDVKRKQIIENGFRSLEGFEEESINRYDLLLEEKMETQNDYEEIKDQIETISNRKSKLNDVRGKVSNEIKKLERAQASGDSLSDLRVTHCPACDQEVNDNIVRDDICFLCHQPTNSDDKDADDDRLDFEVSQLTSEKQELEEMISGIKVDLTNYNYQKRGLEENLRDINQKLDPIKSKVSSLVNSELSDLDSRKGQIREKIENFERLLTNVRDKKDIQSKIDELTEKVNKLNIRIDELSADINFQSISSDLEEGMNEYINKINDREKVWRHGRINFDIGEKGFNFFVGERKWTSLSNNHTAYFLFAYHYGLMSLSDKREYNYPGLLIIDFPLELAVGEEIKGSENYLIEPFVDLSSNLESDHQIIFAGRNFELEGTNNIFLETQWD